MDQTTYDELIQQLDDRAGWHLAAGLAGTSEAVHRFAADLCAASAQYVAPADGLPGCFVVLRPAGAARLDEGILELLGLAGPQRSFVDLCSGAHVFNQGRLFGVARQPGAFEATGVAVMVRGLEALGPDARRRLVEHVAVWRARQPRPVVLFGDDSEPVRRLCEELGGVATVGCAELQPLRIRRQDVPFAIHEAAGRYRGGLDQFDREAMPPLLGHEWPGDLGRLDGKVRELYVASASTDAVRFGRSDVEASLQRWNERRGVRAALEIPDDDAAMWARVRGLVTEADRRTIALLGVPFFVHDTAPVLEDPIDAPWPELGFLRLVSWAYMKFIEAAEPNLRCILRLFASYQLDAKQVEEIRHHIERLRTFAQHHLQLGSSSDQGTIESVYSLFERWIDRRLPEPEHYETCLRCLLSELIDLLGEIHGYLRRVQDDQLRGLMLKQWRRAR